jgi:hypothetical protein
MRQRTLGTDLQVSAAVPRMITVVQSENSLWWRRPEALVAVTGANPHRQHRRFR